MHSIADKKLYRVIDANFNRAQEGLRVCEDICRFIYNKKIATRTYKGIRHQLSTVISQLGNVEVIKARDTLGDVGRKSSRPEFRRDNINDVFYANSQRVKESIRVLEECLKLFDRKWAETLKDLRYQVYGIEKDIVLRR